MEEMGWIFKGARYQVIYEYALIWAEKGEMTNSDKSARHQTWKVVLKAFSKSVNCFGPSATLHLPLTFCDKDPIINQLLHKFSGLVSLGQVLGRIQPYRFEKKSQKNRKRKRGVRR